MIQLKLATETEKPASMLKLKLQLVSSSFSIVTLRDVTLSLRLHGTCEPAFPLTQYVL